MVFDKIIELFLALPRLVLDSLPTIKFEMPADIMATVYDFFEVAGYFLPLRSICTLLGIKLSLWLMMNMFALLRKVTGR